MTRMSAPARAVNIAFFQRTEREQPHGHLYAIETFLTRSIAGGRGAFGHFKRHGVSTSFAFFFLLTFKQLSQKRVLLG